MWGTAVGLGVFVFSAIAVIAVAFGIVYRRRCGQATTTADMKGQTVIITGSSAGIGKEAARDFARRGARVIMAARNLQKTSKVASEIEASTGSKTVVVRVLDTSSLTSVRKFASRILTEERRLDVLVLNAGVGGSAKRVLTSENLERTMATNHFGHFLLTNLLMGLLKESQPSRVVVVSSLIHSQLKVLDIENLNFTKNGSYWSVQATSQSKACNILFARHLATLLKDYGVAVNSMCPGMVASEMFEKSDGFVEKYIYRYLVPILGKTTEQGAQTIIHLAVAEETATLTGSFFEDCKVSDNATNMVLDDGLAKKLWEASEAYVHLKPEEVHY